MTLLWCSSSFSSNCFYGVVWKFNQSHSLGGISRSHRIRRLLLAARNILQCYTVSPRNSSFMTVSNFCDRLRNTSTLSTGGWIAVVILLRERVPCNGSLVCWLNLFEPKPSEIDVLLQSNKWQFHCLVRLKVIRKKYSIRVKVLIFDSKLICSAF